MIDWLVRHLMVGVFDGNIHNTNKGSLTRLGVSKHHQGHWGWWLVLHLG